MQPRIAVILYFFVNGLIFSTWASRIPDIMTRYDIDNGQMGFILLSHSIGAFLAMPVTGYLINQHGSRRITMISALLFCLFFSTVVLAPNYLILFIPFFLMGASTGVMDVAMNAQAVDVEQLMDRPIMTFFHAMFSIGMVVGGIVGGYFISQGLAMSTHFWSIAALAVIVISVARSGLLSSSQSPQEDEEEAPFLVMPRGAVIGLGIIAFCCMIGEGAMSDWSTNYMKNIMIAPESLITFGLTGFAGAMTLGRLFGDQFRVRYGDQRVLFTGAILSIIGMLIILSKVHVFLVILGFGIVGLGLSNIVPIAYSLSGSLPNIPAGTGIAMVTTIGYSGFMLGPPLIGFIADIWDLRVGLLMILILFVVMFGILLRRQSHQV